MKEVSVKPGSRVTKTTLMIFTQDNSVIFGFFHILIKASSFSGIFLLQIQFIPDKLFLSLLAAVVSCCTLDDSCLHIWWWWCVHWWLICIIVEDDTKEHQTICKLQPIISCLCWCGCWDQSSSDLEEIKQLSFSYTQSPSPGQAQPLKPGPGCLKGWGLKTPLSPAMMMVVVVRWGWGNSVLTVPTHHNNSWWWQRFLQKCVVGVRCEVWGVTFPVFVFWHSGADWSRLEQTVTPWVIKL